MISPLCRYSMSTLWSAKVSTGEKGNARGLLEAHDESLCARISTLKFENDCTDQSFSASSAAADRSPRSATRVSPADRQPKRNSNSVLLLPTLPIGRVGVWSLLENPPTSWQIGTANSTAQIAPAKTCSSFNTFATCLNLIWGYVSCTSLLSLTTASGLNSVTVSLR